MSSVTFFYFFKPIVPRRLQIALRRAWALRVKRKSAQSWPIDPVAADKPKDWRGWPGGKKFALVLIHDVDSWKGRDGCRKLMSIERSLGFVSSFNFVPEDYETPAGLRQHIVDSEFEVGVHGLTHKGWAFRNLKSFSKLVPKINGYLREWNAVGFSSPSMLSNLRWVADLDIEYSCSSFDTDPFEPRPFGVATIFPFKVNNLSGRKSYIELPYTLPQDHSLFVILKEKDIQTWKMKLGWVAEQGGLALINTHPDYMDFEGDNYSHDQYPSRNYIALLEWITKDYDGQYWNCLPRTLARFWNTTFPEGTKFDVGETEVTAANRAAIYSRRVKYEREIKLALTCAPGGHFEQMQNLFDLYKDYPRFWITRKTVQTKHALSREKSYFIKDAHFKRPWTYVAQLPTVFQILRKEQPTHIISTGSGMIVFVPFLLSQLLKMKFIHIETFSHVNNLTKMGKLLLKFRQPIFSQWDGIKHKNVRSIGTIITDHKPVTRKDNEDDIIFVTLGTRPQGFRRLVQAVESLVGDGTIKGKVVAQLGSTRYKTSSMETFDFCPPSEVDRLIGSSKYVITQESAGIVTKCLKLGKRFIVMPRDYRHKELPAKSDMNEDLHFRLAELGYTYVVQDKEELKEAIANLERLKTGFHFDNRRAIAALKRLIDNR